MFNNYKINYALEKETQYYHCTKIECENLLETQNQSFLNISR